MSALNQLATVPVIDIGALVGKASNRRDAALAIGRACRDCGFFYIANHGVAVGLQEKLEQLSQKFFLQDRDTKMKIAMDLGGRAWRGFFPVGGELTSGVPDLKEGIYFGAELGKDHPAVAAGLPLHGPNLFPAFPAELRGVVLEYMRALTELGHVLMRGIALSLDLDEPYFADRYTNNPLILFRIFNYPPLAAGTGQQGGWGVGEHTDYGVLTILKQDDSGGLQVKSKLGWVEAPPLANTFVCNIGDMLEKMTGGLYRSTPHRVKNTSGKSRLSFPFFFDPNFDAEVRPLPLSSEAEVLVGHEERWDQANVHDFKGTYGDYLLKKIGKVFPELVQKVLS